MNFTKHTLVIGLLAVIPFLVSAQKDTEMLKALETTPSTDALAKSHEYNKMPVDSYQLLIHGPEKEVEKKFKNFVEVNTGVELKRSKGFLAGDEQIARTIATDSLTLIAQLVEESNGINLVVMASRRGTQLSAEANPTEMNELELLLERFSKSFYTEYYKEVIEDQGKSLDKIQKNVDKTASKIASTQSSLAKSKEKIKSEEVDIKKEENNMKTAQAEKEKLETEKETLQRNVTRFEENIAKNKEELNSYQTEIDGLSASGDTEGKAYKKGMKELTKRQKLDITLYEDLQDTHEDINKLDGKMTKAQEKLNKAESNIRKNESDIKSLENDIQSSERELSDFEKELKSLTKDRDSQKSLLEKIKTAASAVPEK